MSGIDLTEAVEAGTRELHSLRCCDGVGPLACTPDEMTEDENNAINAIRAALPLLEQQIRAQIAAEIEADRPEIGRHINVTDRRDGIYYGMTHAADIARTRKDT